VAIVRIGIGQICTRVGDFTGNVEAILSRVREAERLGVEILLFPENTLTGCPVEDLVFRDSFIGAAGRAMQKIRATLPSSKMVVILGGIESDVALFNAAAVIHKGKILGWARKRYLFCCGRFDESRYFSAGERPLVIETDRFKAAVTIGDDLGYPVFPAEIELLINLWNEPFHYGHRPVKETMMREKSREDAVAIALVSPVGGQDDMIFGGASAIYDGFGEVLARGRSFAEDMVVADLDLRELKDHRQRVFHASAPRGSNLDKAHRITIPGAWPERKKPVRINARIEPLHKGPREIFEALALAVKDYARKNDFAGAIVGVSGGVDSALTLALAREALGAKGVMAVSMPGPFTSVETRRDARKTASNLGVLFKEIPVTAAYRTMLKTLAPAFQGMDADVTEENLQARIRGQVLMALSNKLKVMVLAAANKSEAATGYCTLYGDTCGAFAPLIDVYKTQVYEIAQWYNRKAGREAIPESVLERAPSAELRPDQTDQDALPPYPDLDRILHSLLEGGESIAELVEKGEGLETVQAVLGMLMSAEFKRRQMPIGPTVSERPLSDLRLPLTKKADWWDEAKPAKKSARKARKTARKK